MRYLHPSHIFPDDRRREGENPPPAPDTSEDELVRNFSAGMGLEQNGGMERKTNAKVTLKFFVFGPQMRGGGKKGQRKNRSSQRIASIFKTDEKQKQKGCGECLYDLNQGRSQFSASVFICLFNQGPNYRCSPLGIDRPYSESPSQKKAVSPHKLQHRTDFVV